jgi:ABC-type antimicrobial peptide transport system permease subunit
MVLLASFAAIGLVLAAIGIYGVISYSVGVRTAEIGLRMALGALPHEIRRSVVGEAAVLAGIGLAVGLVGAAGLTQLMRTLLFDVSPMDAASFSAAIAVLASTAIAAAWIPAGRAMRVDPMEALRAE